MPLRPELDDLPAHRHRHRATLKHVYFLGVLLRLELETPSGLVIRARITKEESSRLGLEEDREVSFQIRGYRVLSRSTAPSPWPSFPMVGVYAVRVEPCAQRRVQCAIVGVVS